MIPLIQENLGAIEALCKRHGVKRLFLIGSAATGEFDPTKSDIDFLVEFLPHEPKGWDDVYFKLLEDLEKVLGSKIDLVERHCVRNPVVRRSMETYKVPLYAAA